MKVLLVVSAAVILGGCAAIQYEVMTVDSAPPAAAAQTARCSMNSPAEKPCLALTYADQWTSSTGIVVKDVGEKFCISVLPHQVWFDADRRNTPPYGEKGSWMMNLAKRRHENEGFFALMVDVRSSDDFAPSNTAKAVKVPENFEYVAESTGKLVLYPNDALGPESDPTYYYRKNNSGFVWVSISRCGRQ
ncbi:hypothetical protein [Paucibacter sp. DJ2R-2]|uniref:hypothetical protein n=1 Tax=Paucibacter sp. DJ2R-2 TaxID=2893558 RepID=UPI0021E475E2|nr:hypothetical protein [Paucibacter sp. DJ2R-2]MCV2438711.1 hypothetical protein [Paucibacter sp. DJ2R-2]